MKIIQVMLAFGLLVLAGCSTQPTSNYSPNPKILALALSGEPLLGHGVSPADELPEEDLFGLTEEMKRFAEQATQKHSLSAQKAEALHLALLNSVAKGGRGIHYSAVNTNTGIEAFELRQANCLSYTLLFVAMARHVGVNAQMNEVLLPPTWSMRENVDSYLFMRHVNAKVILSKPQWSWIKTVSTMDVGDIVVDLEMRRYRSHYTQHIISNEVMAAQFYSNRGMELSTAGDAKNGFLNLSKALLLADDISYIWSNIGSIYRRAGLLREAEALYLKGLSVNPEDLTIMHNLAVVYKALGKQGRYTELQKKVQLHRNANPYYIFKQAENAQRQNDYEKARTLIERAIKKEKSEPFFYRFAIIVYERLGDAPAVEKMRWKLAELDKNK